MAQEAPTIFNAKTGMSTTGYIEPSPDIPNAYAYFAIYKHNSVTTHRIFLPYDRVTNKAFLSNHVLLHFYIG
jgi:nicotinamide mononucleotide (NMN) deamidase PncC